MKQYIATKLKVVLALAMGSLIVGEAHGARPHVSLVGVGNQASVVSDAFSASSFNSSSAGKFKAFQDFGIGVLLEYPIKNRWSLEFDILYFRRGFEYEIKDGFTNSLQKVSWLNLFIPMVGRLRVNKNLSGIIGGYYSQFFGKVINENRDFNNGGQLTKTEYKFKDSGFKESEYGLIFGGALDFRLGSTEVLVELRFTEGLSDLNRNEDPTNKTVFRDFQLLFGFRI